MARFTSILFPHDGRSKGVDAAPACIADLHLDEIIAAVTAAHPDDHVDRFFYLPPHELFTVEHRHQVFRDLECEQTRQPILTFVDGMETMRRRLHEAKHLRHPLQRQGWFIYAVQTFCDTVILLRDDLALAELASRGLCDFAQFVAEYADSEAFQNLARDTKAIQTELHNVRYTVHIQNLRVHVEKYEGQTDYSEGAVATFERFTTEVSKDYRVRFTDGADMNHVEAQILECVAKLYPGAFTLLDGFCHRNERFVEPTIVRFDHEIRFYLYYLAFIGRFTAPGLNFSYPEVTTEPGALSADHLPRRTSDRESSLCQHGRRSSAR